MKRFMCWHRHYHRFSVPDIALGGDMDEYNFRGRCEDCGAVTWRTGYYWSRGMKPSLILRLWFRINKTLL
jgi:hypothetical protein